MKCALQMNLIVYKSFCDLNKMFKFVVILHTGASIFYSVNERQGEVKVTCGEEEEEEEEGGGSAKTPLCIRWIVLYKLVKGKKKASCTSGSSWALMLTGPDFLTGPRTMKRTSVKPSESI